MTLGTLIDNMISVVDLNTETTNIQMSKHLNNSSNTSTNSSSSSSTSSTSLINAILTKPANNDLKQQQHDMTMIEENGCPMAKKIKLTTPSPVRSPSSSSTIQQQQQKDIISINDDDSNLAAPTPPPPQRGRIGSITKNLLKGMSIEDQIKLSNIHDNAINEQQRKQQQKEAPTLTPSPSPNGASTTQRVLSPGQQDGGVYPIEPIIPRNRKNSMTLKYLNEDEQINIKNKEMNRFEYADLIKQQLKQQSIELATKESFGNILNTIIDKEIKEPNDFMIPPTHFSAFNALAQQQQQQLQQQTNGNLLKPIETNSIDINSPLSNSNLTNNKEHSSSSSGHHHSRRHHDRHSSSSNNNHHHRHRGGEVIDLIDREDESYKVERAKLLSEARSYATPASSSSSSSSSSKTTAAAAAAALQQAQAQAQVQQILLQQQQQHQQQASRNQMINNHLMHYSQNDLNAYNPQLLNLINRHQLINPNIALLSKLQAEEEQQQQQQQRHDMQRHEMLIKQQQQQQQQRSQHQSSFQLNSTRNHVNHHQSPSPPPTGSLFQTRSPMNLPPQLLEQYHAAAQQQSNQNNAVLSAAIAAQQSSFHPQRNLYMAAHGLFPPPPPHGSPQANAIAAAAAAAAAHQSHIDPSLLHLISPNTIQDYKKANQQQQLLNSHHGLLPQLIPQLNLSSLNPAALAAVENAQVLHSRNLRSPHHNLPPQTSSIRTGTVSQHSNESDLNNKLKQSNSSSQLSLKQQHQLQAQLQQQQIQAQIHQQHLQQQQHHQQQQHQQMQQPNFYKKRLLSSFEAPTSKSSSNVKNSGHVQLKGSTTYEMLSDSEDS